ncbi:MAG: carboxy terminal-processing peptidase [Flavobacteriales bacterium]|nr:carboxy terminal-processing peptidase [Flavobacteriales bacterium]
MTLKKIVLVLVPVSLLGTGFYMKSLDSEKSSLLPAILENLKYLHYNPPAINDEFSKKAFDEFINTLDAGKRFFTEEDLKKLSIYKNRVDDLALEGNYEFFDKTMNIFEGRMNQFQFWYKEILSKPMDFDLDETYEVSDDQPFCKNDAELKERLRKSLKYAVLTRLASSIETQNSAKLKPDSAFVEYSMDTLEARARKGVLKTQDDYVSRWRKIKHEEKISYYINSVTSVFDPHTNYFPPADKENFDINMSGRLEGIGASLQEKDGYIKIVRIVPGSPSALQGELKEGDVILKVAQGSDDPVDVVNMPMDDAIQMIRGPKGTEVRLTVKKPDGSIKVIKIIRDVVILEETFAKSVILEDEDHVKTGYIFLPSFYTDMSGKSSRTCSKDVKNEIIKLKKAGVKSLVIDLRNNGGGSLQDVVTMGGLFIEKGPIVQVKTRGESAEFLEDRDPKVEWDGPLVIMVNQYSASASEILAAAMQDYKRGIVIGSNQTFGKGTVQRFIDLNETIRSKNAAEYGSLKITIQKFYRINGGATQLKGVSSDIMLPDNFAYLKAGEAEQDYPMPWDKIKAANYSEYKNYLKNLSMVKANASKRIRSSEAFNLIEENAKRIKEQDERTSYSLKLSDYLEEQKLRNQQNESLKKAFEENLSLIVSSLPEDEEAMKGDESKKARAKDWHKSLLKDPYLFEALQISEDMLK